MIDLGWTRDQVLDQIDVPFLTLLHEEWSDYPPIRVMVGAYMGIKPKKKKTEQDFAELLGMFPNGSIK